MLLWRVLLPLLLSLLLACGDDSEHPQEEETYIYTHGNSESRGRLSLSASAQSPMVTATKTYTESFYADVTASDRLQIVFMIDDSAAMASARQRLSTVLAALLKHVINSHWSIAVTTLHASSLPQATVTKYKDSFDYEKKFANAVQDLQQITGTSSKQDKNSVLAVVIVTDQDLSAATRDNVAKMLADGGNRRVYALLNTDNSSAFIDWRDTRGQKIINRYASITTEDYALPLQEMSRDLASVLRSNFFLRGYRSLEGRRIVFNGDYLDAKVVWNPSRSGQTGHVNTAELLRPKDKASRTLFINSILPAGLCIDAKYSVGR